MSFSEELEKLIEQGVQERAADIVVAFLLSYEKELTILPSQKEYLNALVRYLLVRYREHKLKRRISWDDAAYYKYSSELYNLKYRARELRQIVKIEKDQLKLAGITVPVFKGGINAIITRIFMKIEFPPDIKNQFYSIENDPNHNFSNQRQPFLPNHIC